MQKRAILSADTSADIEARQVEIWRGMSPQRKLELVGNLRRMTLDLALVGIRSRHPGASERECFLRLMILTLGPALARAAYPEIDALDPPLC